MLAIDCCIFTNKKPVFMRATALFSVLTTLVYNPFLAFQRLRDQQGNGQRLFFQLALPAILLAAFSRAASAAVLSGEGAGFWLLVLIQILALTSSMQLGSLLISRLAPSFASMRGRSRCLQLIILAYMPFLLIQLPQAFLTLPFSLGLPGLAATVFLYARGLPVMMQTPPDRIIGFTAVSFLVLLGIFYSLLMVLSPFVIFAGAE